MRQTIINVSRHVEFDLKNEIYNHYQQLSIAFYKRNRTGDLMSRISEDVSKVRMYIGPALYVHNQYVNTFYCCFVLYVQPIAYPYTLYHTTASFFINIHLFFK